MKKIAIIGSGISGLSAAYFLKDRAQIKLFEKKSRLGGHSRTITLENNMLVDTGFIVLNDRNYPNLLKLFSELNIELEKTSMSFSVSMNQGKLEWAGESINTFFAQRKNLFSFSMLKGIFDILKFNKKAYSFINSSITLGELIEKINLGSWFKNAYIIPMGSAIWSCPPEKILQFPASSFINFFHNHGLLSLYDRPQWYTLKNKSIDYVEKLEKLILEKGNIVYNQDISVIRKDRQVWISDEAFDEVIFACHPEEILKIIDASEQEKELLSKFKRQKNIAYTHSDSKQMPQNSRCWSSWNYDVEKTHKNVRSCVTYWMNKLQNIQSSSPLFVTLNPIRPINEKKIHDIYEFYHPIFDHEALEGQKEIQNIQGNNQFWFCGAYLRNGFHEDGIWSTLTMIEKMA